MILYRKLSCVPLSPSPHPRLFCFILLLNFSKEKKRKRKRKKKKKKKKENDVHCDVSERFSRGVRRRRVHDTGIP